MKRDFLAMMGFPSFVPFWDEAGEGGSGAAAGSEGGDGAGEGGEAPAGGTTALTAKTDTGDGEGGDASGDGGKGSEGEGKGDESNADPGEFKLEVPEGMEAFGDDFAAYSSDAQKWLTDNPKASAADALKWAADRQADAVKQQMVDTDKAFKDQLQKWEGEAKADKEVGGDKYGENVAIAQKAVKAFGSEELTGLLEQTGLGSHPEMIKLFHRVGKHLAESPVVTTQGGEQKKSFATAMYGGGK